MDSSISARQNFKRWMPPRRFSRLTDALSKRIENHAKAFSLFVMSYNYCRPDPGLTNSARGVATTPAMVAGISDHVWSVEEILELAGSGEIAILS
jgi:hypothetical protein